MSRSRSPEFLAWKGMIARCHNPKYAAYADYGGRGIAVCPEWRASFEAFLHHAGRKPSPALELDRIDNDRGYEPGNVRWTTRSENDRNRRSTTWVTYRGERAKLIELCERLGLPKDTVRYRLAKGWTVDAALETPVRPKRPRGTGWRTNPPARRWSCARLSDEQRREMARLYAGGGWTHSRLAAHFGCKPSVVGNVLKDPRWAAGPDGTTPNPKLSEAA